jgi:hypothetical protein
MDTPPFTIVSSLNMEELEELHKDVKMYLSLEKDKDNRDFWQSMLLICDDELTKKRGGLLHTGLANDILQDIERLLSSKTLSQLDSLYHQVEAKLHSGQPIDVGKWTCVH